MKDLNNSKGVNFEAAIKRLGQIKAAGTNSKGLNALLGCAVDPKKSTLKRELKRGLNLEALSKLTACKPKTEPPLWQVLLTQI